MKKIFCDLIYKMAKKLPNSYHYRLISDYIKSTPSNWGLIKAQINEMQEEKKEDCGMIKVVCPKCGSEKIDYIDSNHQELLFEERHGYTDGIYRCPKCRIDFGTWTEFNIEITHHTVEWVEDWEEEEEECDD